MPSKKRGYTKSEEAFLLSYADYCIANKADYRKTVTSELELLSQRRVQWSSVRGKLELLVFQNGQSSRTGLPNLLNTGTVSLNISLIEPDLKAHMEKCLAQWGLEPLGTAAVPSANRATSAVSDTITLAEVDVADVVDTVERQPESASLEAPTEAQKSVAGSTGLAKHTTAQEEVIEVRDSEARDSEISDVGQQTHINPGQPDHTVSANACLSTQPKNTAAAATTPKSKPRGSRAKTLVSYAESSDSSATLKRKRKRPAGKREVGHELEFHGPSKRVRTTAPTHAESRVAAGKRKATKDFEETISSKQPKTSSTNQREKPLKAIAESDKAQIGAMQKEIETLKMQVNATIDLNKVLLNNYKTSAGGLSEQSVKDVQHVLNQVQHIPDKAIQNMANDALAESENLTILRELLKKIIYVYDPVNDRNDFPKVPSLHEQDKAWQVLREAVAWTVGYDNATPLPSPSSASYLTARVEDIANGRVPDVELGSYIRNLRKYLVSPHAMQLLLSALLCRLVFQTPEPLLEGEHTKGWMKLYEAVAVEGGLAQVQRFDKVALQTLFEDKTVKEALSKRRMQKVAYDFTKIAKEIVPPPNGRGPKPKNPEIWAAKAIESKKAFMLSPMDYRIHYVEPGTKFDPTWMQAVDARNSDIADEEVKGKEVTICLFPALEQLDPTPFNDSSKVEDALAKNKRFFPNSNEKEMFVPTDRMSRATVLVFENDTVESIASSETSTLI